VDEIKQPDDIRQNNTYKRKKVALVVFAVMTLIAIVSVFFYLRYKSTHITTDERCRAR